MSTLSNTLANVLALALACGVAAAPTPAAAATQTVGLFVNATGAWEGYTLFAPKHYGSTYLINNEGRVVHAWHGSMYEPGQSVYLLESGHLLRSCMVRGALNSGGGEGGRIEEYDWDGNLVWELSYATSTYMQHHDIKPLPNGNILMLVVEKKTVAEALAAGFNPSTFQDQITQQGYMLPDAVVEIEPTYPSGGTVVWSWHVWDHLVQDYNPSAANYGVVAAHPELVNPAADGSRIPSFWNHMNAIYYNAELDQIVLSVRGNSEVWVIDHSTTTAEAASHSGGRRGRGGDLLYRWGNPIMYRAGAKSDQMLYQQHDAQWIDADCPGAGNMIAFNNGLGRNYSTVDEWAPPVDASGSYVLTAGAAYGPTGFTWSYEASPPTALYAEAISSAQRLPNGNTLICDGTHGTFLEVTAAGQTVWKYVCPVDKTGPLAQGATIPEDPARAGEYMNAVFRVRRYPVTHPGLVGRDLTPGDRVEIDPRPLAGFAHLPGTPQAGETVTFTDQSGKQPTSWSWSFGDGGTSTQQSPTHTYTTAGTYTVTLTASNASGSDTATRTLTVTGSVPTQPVLVLPAVAHLRGLSATFTSRLEILNASDAAMTVTATYTPRTDIGGAAHTTTLTLQPGLLHTVDDPLATWFGFAAATKAVGSLSFTVTSGTAASLLVQSVITARNDDGSEYGQDLPATREAAALQTGATAYLASLVDASRTRINLAAMALDDGTVLTVRPVDPLGTPLAAARTLALGAGVSTQLNDLNGTAGFALGTQANYLLEVAVASGRAVVYASVLDGTSTVPGSSDPTTILPVTAGASTVTLLELGPIQGLDEFSGSAQIANLSATAAAVTADFHARGVPGVSASATLTIPAGDTLGYTDLVGELFGTSGVGTVVLRATNGTAIMATGREFSIRRDAGGEVSGTAGQLIPGMPDGERLEAGATYHLLGLRQRTVAAGVERSHLAVFNPGSQSATVTVTLLDGATGVPEGTTTLTVGAGELVRLNNVIPTIHAAQDGTTKRLTLTTDRPVFVKAFRVNAWGDPITVDALAAP